LQASYVIFNPPERVGYIVGVARFLAFFSLKERASSPTLCKSPTGLGILSVIPHTHICIYLSIYS